MNKKSIYLIIALIFIILAMGWQLYIRTQPTEKEQEEAKKEANKLPDPQGQKIYEKTSFPFNNGLRVGVESIPTNFASCNFTYPNGETEHEYMHINESKHFTDKQNKGYDIILLSINKDEKGEYGVFSIVENNTVVLSYEEKKQLETQEKQKRAEEAIILFEKRINEKVEDAFMDSRVKMSLDIDYDKGQCTIQKIEQYREKEKELPSGYSRYDIKVTYFFKVYVNTPDGTKKYKTDYYITLEDDNGVAKIDKPLMLDFDEL